MADDIQAQIKAAAAKGGSTKKGTGESVLQKQLANIQQEIAEKDIAREAKDKGLNYISLLEIPLRADVLHILTREEITSAKAVVFNKTGKQLQLACVDPNLESTKAVIDSLKQKGFKVQVFLCSEKGIDRVLEIYGVGEKKEIEVKTVLSEEEIADVSKSERDFSKYAEKIKGLSSTEALNLIHLLAVTIGSSDVHLEPTEADAILRFRMDGILREIFHIELKQYDQIATQVKHNAGVKINVRDVPQDGEYAFGYQDRKIRVRMSTLPTEQGESIVLRILDSKSVLIDFEQLGFEKGNLGVLEKALRISYGMILVTGPTGSGKTTTLYTSLRHMNSAENKVITLEDPMEYELPGIVQSEVHPDGGYDFDTGLKAILRQDPDVIMVGEIRDLPSAETAAQSALTGHVVLSTLHTNSALAAIPRLLDMGVKPFVLAPALHTVMAQRLVRVLCEKCKKERDLTDSEKTEIANHIERIQKVRSQGGYQMPSKVFDSEGCDECHHTGFSGRSAVTEIIEVDDDLKLMISSGAKIEEIQKRVIEEKDMLFMIEDGIIKVLEGKTTLTEVLRAVGG
jgi:type II secretory ATPase GspE/PulE/Tfp pilus assembly ATPase PilB-like protein